MTTWNDQQHRDDSNARTRDRLAYALAHRGYLTAYLGGKKIHACIATVKGHSGYIWPRALCQPHTPSTYAAEYDPEGDEREVTCARGLASMDKRDLVGGNHDRVNSHRCSSGSCVSA